MSLRGFLLLKRRVFCDTNTAPEEINAVSAQAKKFDMFFMPNFAGLGYRRNAMLQLCKSEIQLSQN